MPRIDGAEHRRAGHQRLHTSGRGAFGRLALVAGAMMLSCTTSYGADIQTGKALAVRCAVCHGANGIATAPDAPNLAGQNEMYLAKALRDFRSGARENEIMSLMAKGLSDADIENLAAYYHDISIKVDQP